jgi:hypothetical protein
VEYIQGFDSRFESVKVGYATGWRERLDAVCSAWTSNE